MFCGNYFLLCNFFELFLVLICANDVVMLILFIIESNWIYVQIIVVYINLVNFRVITLILGYLREFNGFQGNYVNFMLFMLM